MVQYHLKLEMALATREQELRRCAALPELVFCDGFSNVALRRMGD
jgi:hypothetical protein